MISGDYPINFDKVKKDISALLLPKFGTTLCAHTNLDSIVLFSLISLIVLCSSSTHHYAFYCNHVSLHGLYGPASGIGRTDIFFFLEDVFVTGCSESTLGDTVAII